MSKSHFAPAVLSGLACIVASGAQAQQAPAPAESAASAPQAVVLEQVVVTSQKRREDVRKVPLSISVLSGEVLNTLYRLGAVLRRLDNNV